MADISVTGVTNYFKKLSQDMLIAYVFLLIGCILLITGLVLLVIQ